MLLPTSGMSIRKYKGNIPDRIVINSDDINVGSYVIYSNGDGIAYYDVDGFYPINSDKLENLYVKGLLISYNGMFYTPVAMSKVALLVSISFIEYDVETDSMLYSTITGQDRPIVIPPLLDSLSIGEKVLTPAFDPEVFEYTMTTEVTSDILTLTTLPIDAEVVVKLDDVINTEYGEGIVWDVGENVVTITVGDELVPVVYTITVTKVAAPIAPRLASLTLGASVLTPSFDPDVFVYTAPTTETSDVLTLTALPPEAVLEVKLGENVVTDYDDTGIVWGEGENVVTITVGDELVPVVYTITVTKS